MAKELESSGMAGCSWESSSTDKCMAMESNLGVTSGSTEANISMTKKMDSESTLGQMDAFTKVTGRMASSMDSEYTPSQMCMVTSKQQQNVTDFGKMARESNGSK